jgi:hypothetical protein
MVCLLAFVCLSPRSNRLFVCLFVCLFEVAAGSRVARSVQHYAAYDTAWTAAGRYSEMYPSAAAADGDGRDAQVRP